MSAPSESATSPSPCACTNISLMQLFHELKQKFPGVPDHVVSNTIELYCHDKQACETHLHSEVKASLTHAYHASSSAAARQLNELKLNPPSKCRNQPIIKQEVAKFTPIKSVICEEPQTAVLSSCTVTNENDKQPTIDDNQNVVELKNNENERRNNNTSPVTVINIDNCYAKYSAESPSDLESTNDHTKQELVTTTKETPSEQPESTNYRLLKTKKIKSNLNVEIEKEKKTIKKEERQQEIQVPPQKPQRPKTLDFIKPNPDIAFKPTLKETETEQCRTVSPVPSQKNEAQTTKETKSGPYRQERGYPLNLSVNVNCHMDYSRGYGDPWLEDYDSPRAITSVNLTVCTPTSSMASPVRDTREEDGGFEGHVTVTVSPSTARPPRRPAPPPPTRQTRLESPRPTRAAPEPPGSTMADRSLIERQKERLSRLATALAQEKGRLAQLNRETQILEEPPPPAVAAQRLKEYVEKLRDQCDMLAKRLEMGVSGIKPVTLGSGGRVATDWTIEPEDAENFYSNIYTGQRPPSSWQCHVCTFRNHPLLDKCEQCEMPRIFVGTSPARTHDSGFGSFRDKDRRINSQGSRTDISDTGALINNNIVEDSRPSPRLNC